jgi:two-component system response regulator PilR (NtrC family)
VSVSSEVSRSVARVLIANANQVCCEEVQCSLEAAGHVVRRAADGQTVLDLLTREDFDVVVLDLDVPRVSGLNILAALPSMGTDAKFIVMAGHGTVDSAVEAMKAGACDYLERPVAASQLLAVIERGIQESSLTREVRRVRRSASERGLSAIVGATPAMQKVFRLVERVAPTRASVLVTGETGTGKDLVARAVHDLSPRAAEPFLAVSCSAIPSTLLEAELFGHTRGSFTGAVQSRKGLIEEAAGGTLFLDEISTLSEDVQVKLLRVLQDRRVQRVGSSSPVPVDFRLVAATNKDLGHLVEAGLFREDLFFRLDVFPIPVPPLRERRDDILALADHFLERFGDLHGIEAPRISPSTLARMMSYDWPGNVRELENFIERSVIMHPGARSFPFDLPRPGQGNGATAMIERALEDQWTLDRLEREYLLSTLERTRWRQSAAAELLGINRRTIHRKLTRYKEEGLLPDLEET